MQGIIKQFRPIVDGQIENNILILPLPNFPVTDSQEYIKIGISISEKDFMRMEANGGFYFNFGEKDENEEYKNIKMGKTCMYETQKILANNLKVIFPYECPQSVLVQVVY